MTEVTKRRHRAAASGRSHGLPLPRTPQDQKTEMFPLPASIVCYDGSIDGLVLRHRRRAREVI